MPFVLIQQRAKLVPVHLQEAVWEETNTPHKEKHIVKLVRATKNTFN